MALLETIQDSLPHSDWVRVTCMWLSMLATLAQGLHEASLPASSLHPRACHWGMEGWSSILQRAYVVKQGSFTCE